VIRTAEDFKSLERAIAAMTNRLSALLLAEATQAALDDSENRAPGPAPWLKGRATRSRIKADATSRSGRRAARSSSGATYFSRNCDRSKSGKGMYPMLLLGGVHDRCTAAVVSEISKLVAMRGSLEEVEQVLSDRGQPLDFKSIGTIAYRFRHARPGRPACGRLELGRDRRGPWRGRLHRWRPDSDSDDQARSQDRQGRNRYRTDWREPKLLIIYVVDENGQMDREFLAVIDGTPGGPDAIFKLMEFYLRELRLPRRTDPVRRDGAPLDLEPGRGAPAAVGGQTGPGQRVGGLLSCGGASGHDRGLAASLDGGGASGVDRSQRRRLLKGGAEEVQAAIDAVCGSRPGKACETGARILQTERGGKGRMDYARDYGVEVADRQWCDRECDSPCREPAVEGAEHLLAQDECGGRSAVTFVLQGGTLGSILKGRH